MKENNWDWYDQTVGMKGHYYHEHLILPKVLHFLKSAQSVLDLACGQGVLARKLPSHIDYVGIDLSSSLISAAKKYSKHRFLIGDITRPLAVKKEIFSHATLILALQNIKDPLSVFKNAHSALKKEGELILVLNHPCFRIPRQSSWGIDEKKQLQYRRIDCYFSPLEIPIFTRPSQKESSHTLSYHFPLSTYCAHLKEAGFVITLMEEWCSDKKSSGKAARMENRARKEFPLFLTLIAKKL